MKKAGAHRFNIQRCALLAAFAGGLAACGGVGGGAPPPPPVTLKLTAANGDTVAHATAAGLLSFGSSVMLPYGADTGASAQAMSARALGGNGPAVSSTWLPQRVLVVLSQASRPDARLARSGAERPLALISEGPMPCGIAGTSTFSFDDADNDSYLDVGESFTFAFDNSQDSAAQVLDGSLGGTITRVNSDGTQFGATMTLAGLSQQATNGRHGVTLSGRLLMDYRQTSETTESMNLRVDGPVIIAVRTHLPYDDTVTLQNDFAQNSTYDLTLGRTTSAVSGVMDSTVARGRFAVATPTPFEVDDSEVCPRAGVVTMTGRTGTMTLRALSADLVQVELDANGDGIYETGTPQTWDWLL